MKIAGHDIGVCSWSFRGNDPAQLVAKVRELGLDHLQLGLNGPLSLDEQGRARYLQTLRDSGLVITAGMIGFPGEDYSSIASIRQSGGFMPDDLWTARRQLALDAGRLAANIGIKQVSTHIGFVPPSHDPHYTIMLDRLREIAREYDTMGLRLLMETGQERANELLQFLNDLSVRNVKVNFDPANMILYGAGDPIEAVGILGRHIGHVHLKDANLSDQPGTKWGKEVIFGRGQVGVRRFLEALRDVKYTGPLIFEQEIDEGLVGLRESIDSLRAAEKEMGLSGS